MIDERIIGSISESIGFARVETEPKSKAATIAERYPIIKFELLSLYFINL